MARVYNRDEYQADKERLQKELKRDTRADVLKALPKGVATPSGCSIRQIRRVKKGSQFVRLCTRDRYDPHPGFWAQ